MCLVGENRLRGNSPKMNQVIPSLRTSVDRQAHSTVPSAAPHGYAARPNRAVSSGRIAASLVEWHLEGEDQACLVPVSDWPMRALVREQYRPYHDREILQSDPELVAAIIAEIDVRGPLSSLDADAPSPGYGFDAENGGGVYLEWVWWRYANEGSAGSVG